MRVGVFGTRCGPLGCGAGIVGVTAVGAGAFVAACARALVPGPSAGAGAGAGSATTGAGGDDGFAAAVASGASTFALERATAGAVVAAAPSACGASAPPRRRYEAPPSPAPTTATTAPKIATARHGDFGRHAAWSPTGCSIGVDVLGSPHPTRSAPDADTDRPPGGDDDDDGARSMSSGERCVRMCPLSALRRKGTGCADTAADASSSPSAASENCSVSNFGPRGCGVNRCERVAARRSIDGIPRRFHMSSDAGALFCSRAPPRSLGGRSLIARASPAAAGSGMPNGIVAPRCARCGRSVAATANDGYASSSVPGPPNGGALIPSSVPSCVAYAS